jgi:hypothetical protein
MVVDKRWRGALVVLALAACAPALDWREVRPAESEAVAMFPCKPQRASRDVTLAGAKVRMHLAACSAETVTYALGHVLLADPSKVNAALAELRAASAANIGARAASGVAWSVPGMTPNPLAEKLVMEGRDAAGETVREEAAFFVKGLRVYQATVVGPQLDREAVDTFFSGLKLTP